jgi:hypothetical protein
MTSTFASTRCNRPLSITLRQLARAIGTLGNHQKCPRVTGIDREAVYSDESGLPFSTTANVRRPTAAAEDFLSTLGQPEMESNCPWRRRAWSDIQTNCSTHITSAHDATIEPGEMDHAVSFSGPADETKTRYTRATGIGSEMKTIKPKGDFALRGLGIDETCCC